MHETLFAKRIIDEAKKHDDGTIASITVELGELGHVPPEELAACLKEISPWTVHHVVKEAKIECDCGFNGHPTIIERGHDYFFIECPECQAQMPKVIEGTDIKLVSVTKK